MSTLTDAAATRSATWPGGEPSGEKGKPGCRVAYDKQQRGGAKK